MTRRIDRPVVAIVVVLAALATAHAGLVINEVMYNSRLADDALYGGDVEYIEIYNTGPDAVDMTGWYLLDDNPLHRKCYLVGTLQPGEYWVVPGFTSRFTAKYPGVTNLNPNQFDDPTVGVGWGLANSSDDVRLHDPTLVLLDLVHYNDQPPWPTAADGTGPSLELRHPLLDNFVGTSWSASISTTQDGTPGQVNSTYQEDQPPLMINTSRDIPLPAESDTVVVTSLVTDDHGVTSVKLYVDEGSGYAPRTMYDDGLHGDGGMGDSVYGASIAPHARGVIVRYYVTATDTLPQTALDPPTAPTERYGYTVGYAPPNVVINEVLPRNVTGIVDEASQHEDWLELKNREVYGVNLSGFYLTDQTDRTRQWRIADGTVIPGGGRLYFWCDSDVGQGPRHTTFKLGADGGFVGLFDTMDHGNVPVNTLTFGLTGADVSFGFVPEQADAREYIATPTPGESNDGAPLFSPVCINEFLTSSAAGGIDDWVELYNRGTVAVDISGWHLSDSKDVCEVPPDNDYTFPPGTVIPAGGFLVVDEAALGFGFDINGGDFVMLTHSDCLTGQDYFDHGVEIADVTHGRLPNGAANWKFFSSPTQGFANSCPSTPPALGPVTGLRFPSIYYFEWDSVDGAERYDIVKGGLAALLGSGGDFSAALTGCLENNSSDPRAWDAAAVPAGAGRFYLVRATTFSCLEGTYNEGSSSQVGDRDAEIASVAGACP